MKILLPICVLLIPIILLSCKEDSSNHQSQVATANVVSRTTDTFSLSDYYDSLVKTIPPNCKPILGHRFEIVGDFNGDGKLEKLKEHYVSGVSRQETNKSYENLNGMEFLQALVFQKKPISYLLDDNRTVDTLFATTQGVHIGLSYAKNEGDLNGDKTDELSYVVEWVQESNLNTWHVVTFKNGKWIELLSFDIWDWQLNELRQGESLLKKVGKNKVQIIYRNDRAEKDTMMVTLPCSI